MNFLCLSTSYNIINPVMRYEIPVYKANLKKNNEAIDNDFDVLCRITKYKNKMTIVTEGAMCECGIRVPLCA